jgi:hypothetical protein
MLKIEKAQQKHLKKEKKFDKKITPRKRTVDASQTFKIQSDNF